MRPVKKKMTQFRRRARLIETVRSVKCQCHSRGCRVLMAAYTLANERAIRDMEKALRRSE